MIDGTGAPVRPNQTLVLRDGTIAEIADSGTVKLIDSVNGRAGIW